VSGFFHFIGFRVPGGRAKLIKILNFERQTCNPDAAMNWNLHESLVFFGFLLFIFLMLAVDLGIFNRKSHAMSFREALGWTMVWVFVSFVFYLAIRFFGNQLHGLTDIEGIKQNILKFHHPIKVDGMSFQEAISLYNRNLSLEYLTGYLIEYSLSVDNIFVIIMIFLSFNIQQRYYHRVLFWGILGAIIMRFIFIFAASALIQRYEAVLYFFGGLLVIVGIKMGKEFFTAKEEDRIDQHRHPLVRFISKIFPVTTEEKGSHFWVREKGKTYITPLLIVLIFVEFMDVVFAVDSVPAVFSVTRDPYIVFFSNIFAILGLRSLFFLVNDVMNRFRFLKLGLGFLLTYVGIKMILQEADILHVPTKMSLLIIILILGFFVILSMLFPERAVKK
jgi:tellurite resistance protein TerC